MKTETLQLVTKIEHKDDITTLIAMEKYSSLNKLYSVTAFVYRFLCNLKNSIKNKHQNLLEGPLTTEELNMQSIFGQKHSKRNTLPVINF